MGKITFEDVLKTGVVVDSENIVNSVRSVYESYGYNHESATNVKKSPAYLAIIQAVNDLKDKDVPKEQVALLNHWIGERFCYNCSNYLAIPFLEESFALYKSLPAYYENYLNCGQHLIVAYDDYELFNQAVKVLKTCLEDIEKHEGMKNDKYCKFVYYTIINKLGNTEYREFLKWFISDYSINDPSLGNGFYNELCWQITQLYNAKLSDEEHHFWFESYLKYKNLDIQYRSQISEEKKERGYYDLGVMYSCEYGRTNSPEYLEAAKRLLLSIKGNCYIVAQQQLEKL